MTKAQKYKYQTGKARIRSWRNTGYIDQKEYENECQILKDLIKDKHYTAPILRPM